MPVDLSKLTDEQLEAYRSLRQGQPQEQSATPPPQKSGGLLSSFWSTLQGPRDIGNGLIEAGRHLFDTDPRTNTLNRMGNQTIDLGKRAVSAFGHGDIKGGVRKTLNAGINAAVPGLGASSEDAGEAFDRGDYREGFGKTLGVAGNATTMALAPRLVPPAARAVAETVTPGVRGPFGRLVQADPRVALNRGLRPVPSDPGFPERVPQTLAAIKTANGGETPGGITAGQMDLIPATERAIAAHQEALNPWMQRAAGRPISGAPIIQATRDATGRMLPSESGSAEGLINRAQRDYGMDFSPDALRDRLRLLNERMSPFYASSPARQSSALADIPEAVLKAQRDATADTLYRALDPEGGGAGPRLIQSRTGDLMDIKNAALRRNNAIVAEQPLTPLGRMLTPFKALARELMPQRVGTGLAYAEGSEGRSLPFIRRAFNAVDETPNALPKPGTPFYPTGSPTRLISAPNQAGRPGVGSTFNFKDWDHTPNPGQTGGTMYTPPPADTSFVKGVPLSPHERVNMERPMLPAGTAPFTQGTVVPDILGRPGQSMHHLLPRPTPTPVRYPGQTPEDIVTSGQVDRGQGIIAVPPAGARNTPTLTQVPNEPRMAAAPEDTSGVHSTPAASQVVRDPATGRMKRIYTSQPK